MKDYEEIRRITRLKDDESNAAGNQGDTHKDKLIGKKLLLIVVVGLKLFLMSVLSLNRTFLNIVQGRYVFPKCNSGLSSDFLGQHFQFPHYFDIDVDHNGNGQDD